MSDRLCQSLLNVADSLDTKGNFKLAQKIDDMVGRIRDDSEELHSPETFLDLLKTQLQKHDWLYDFSDDFGVYQRGMNNEKRLLGIAKDLGPEAEQLFNEIRNKALERVRK